jgi:hypothetical protein
MAEWSNAAVSKTVVRRKMDRGFESPPLRKKSIPASAGFFFKERQAFIDGGERKIKR